MKIAKAQEKNVFSLKIQSKMHALCCWSKVCIPESFINLFSVSLASRWGIPGAAPTWAPGPRFWPQPLHVVRHAHAPGRRTAGPGLAAAPPRLNSFPLSPVPLASLNPETRVGNSRRKSERSPGLPPSWCSLNLPDIGVSQIQDGPTPWEQTEPKEYE